MNGRGRTDRPSGEERALVFETDGPRLKPRRTAGARWEDEARFIKTWFENPKATGAVSPSGRSLSRTMARYVDPAVPGPVIELGPGTGPVTEALIRRGVAPDRLVLVEYDAAFCKLLARRFPGCHVVQGDAYALGDTLRGLLDEPAAAVVSSLPLLNRPDPERLRLLAEAFALLHPRGPFVQFTYGLTSPVPRHRSPWATRFEARVSAPVWLNLPPARVWIYRPPGSAAGAAGRLDDKPDMIDKLKAKREQIARDLKEQRARLRAELQLRSARVKSELEARGTRRKRAKAKPSAEVCASWSRPAQPRRRPQDGEA